MTWKFCYGILKKNVLLSRVSKSHIDTTVHSHEGNVNTLINTHKMEKMLITTTVLIFIHFLALNILLCKVLKCLSRLLFTLKLLLQYSHPYGLSPVCFLWWISIDACEGNILLHSVHCLLPSDSSFETVLLHTGVLVVGFCRLDMCSSNSVWALWMCFTHSAGVGNACWHRSHISSGKVSFSYESWKKKH